ncbi:para-aminobenzoate synthetase/4-amino-4-deoxychorismate lyase [Ilumatobacter fluminis]|uniref:Para-aminobenzoate synthetase/4-amino-4-deoxychorismate lyase n=1 Tax=Ilumatobacter fluminis TaxID=467091 RepID=A0A4R7HVW4_9ACTN|nr:chorismate-binding protein [Ilumatobacter fluminis]TDT15005.1 para-aminobenzoate synthetase/4-amino-4-deoxychorismate lyase [Ilumatobacter fluminis]
MIRLDDLSTEPGAWQFDDPVATGRADTVDRVRAVLAAADERARRHDEWVVVVMAYEAAPAFDPAMRTAPAPPDGIPYVWWESFAERRAAEPLSAADARPGPPERRPSRWPYTDAVEFVRSHIEVGDVYQVNITDRFDGGYVGSPLDVYQALVAAQSGAFGAYVEMGDRIVASASPELFFRWDGDVVTCRPMKGTAARRPRPDDDRAAAEVLRASAKEQAENVMIVDLLRNDLGRLATVGSVAVPSLFDIERYETVWQMTSTITAEMPDYVGLLDVFEALFPCGSVTGAPKISAMQTIREAELDPRGVYCGAIGVLAPPSEPTRAVFSVPIRTAVIDPSNRTYEYGAGGGITWSSDPAAEDREVEAKARVLTTSLRRDGTSLFETLRNDRHGVQHVALHADRMAASADWFGLPFDRALFGRRLAAVPPAPQVERVRVTLHPDGELAVEVLPLDDAPDVVRLAIDTEVTRSDDPFCCHKTTMRDHYDAARSRRPDADDVVLVNQHGNAIETTIANVAYLIDDRWWCPPLDDGGLAGVARHLAVESGRLAERSIAAADLVECAEVAVLNDLRGWRRATIVD